MPQWRALDPQQFSTAVSMLIRRGGRNATKVVERYVPDTDGALLLPFTAPLVVWGMFRTLSVDERVVWIVWTLLAFMLLRLSRRERGAVVEHD
jgi:hypothetical protein